MKGMSSVLETQADALRVLLVGGSPQTCDAVFLKHLFTSVVRLPLFLIVVFTISAAAQEQPENNQFNGLDCTCLLYTSRCV